LTVALGRGAAKRVKNNPVDLERRRARTPDDTLF
jgi:hypothetical protein